MTDDTATTPTVPPEVDPDHPRLPVRAGHTAAAIRTGAEARDAPDIAPCPQPAEDHAPCRTCGIAVRRDLSTAPLVTVTVDARPDALGRTRPPRDVPLAHCPSCARRDALGQRLTGDADTGGRVVALTTLLGLSLPAASDRRRLDTLTAVGAFGLTYFDRLGHHDAAEATALVGHVAAVPFGHITRGDLARLRAACAAHVTRRLARATVARLPDDRLDVAPPPLDLDPRTEDPRLAIPDACAVCGVAVARAPRPALVDAMVDRHIPTDPDAALVDAARAAWTRLSVCPRNLGADPPRDSDRHVRLAGWTCPRCTAVVAPSRWSGARHDAAPDPWTSRMVGRALAAFLGVPGAGFGGGPLLDAPAFASVVVDARRHGQPARAPHPTAARAWDHVDLSDARRRLRLPDPDAPRPARPRPRGGSVLSITPAIPSDGW